ncbi:heme-binding beta-barrel domain-containing protein [Enterovibrio makurazakiensis]|uniref:heme-binding beta-barrel domain-containing protein n=1 Tax=Enterovibrio makurazakiensis TaxID=2910232 RepID=UPI003D197BC2
MKKICLSAALMALPSLSVAEESTIINGLDFGPLAGLVGTWKSVDSGGVDVAPGQEGTKQGKGGPSVKPFYETITFTAAADATNASDQYLVSLYYEQEVFKKEDNAKFHDQRGYLIYDKVNQVVYNSFCVPRAVCIVTQGDAGNNIQFSTAKEGMAQSQYMFENATTSDFTMVLDFSEKDILRYTQTTSLNIYDKPFSHSDSSTLMKISAPNSPKTY